jgi:fluoride exporter
MNGAGALAVGVGAALGAWLRWALGVGLNAVLPQLPLGTLAANLIGGYLIGVAVALFELHGHLAPELRLFVVTGFLGGLTTFSAFSGEAVALLMSERWGWAVMHIGAHLTGSIALTILGLLTVRALA